MSPARHHYLGIDESDLDREVYRIFSLQRLLELLRSERNTLVRPSLWDDPFENYVLSAVERLKSDERFSIGFKDKLYGQCWTLDRDSDAMWRIYSPDRQGVRVRSTIRRLLESLLDTSKSYPELSCFIGKVSYLPQYKLVQMLNDAGGSGSGILDPSGRGQARTLLVKREEFSHEKEIRLIHFSHEDDYSSEIYQYPINPTKLIDEVAFDPRLSEEMVDLFSDFFYGLGFSKRQVRQSPLYKLPDLEVKLRGV
ncbi:MAG: DUF2971 domain-containing protein [Bacteroidota bacterium]